MNRFHIYIVSEIIFLNVHENVSIYLSHLLYGYLLLYIMGKNGIVMCIVTMFIFYVYYYLFLLHV